MANTSSRTLRLLSLLQTHRHWPGVELAERLGVSVRTLRRDVDRLRDLGYPVRATRGAAGGYQLEAGAALPPLVVDDDEAVALAVGMSAAAQGGLAGIEESAVRALTKVVQVMPPALRRRVDALRAVTVPAALGSPGPSVSPEVLIAVAQACRDYERMQFRYTAGSGEQTDRHVEPHRLVPLGRRWYLVAYDLTRHGWRSFRLDRLTGPRTTATRFRPRDLPAGDAAAFVRAGIEDMPSQYAVEALIEAPAEQIRERIGRWCTVEDAGSNRCRMRMTAVSLDWPTSALGAVDADFEVLAPPELAERIRELGDRFTRATGRARDRVDG